MSRSTEVPRRSLTIDRRGFLVSTGGALLLAAGCSPDVGASGPGPSSSASPSTAPVTASALIGSTAFTVAHRGSYDNWPEHTLLAYESAVRAGAQAIEVSVCATSDGVLVCHHDKTTNRTSDVDVVIAETSYADLQKIPVNTRAWLGPSAPVEPVPRLKDVLDRLAAAAVIFIEDKQGTNAEALLDLMDTYPNAHERFVWKQWAGSGQYKLATERGYLRWGYFTLDSIKRLAELQDRFDCLGVPVEATDAQVSAIVAVGKPVMAWEVHRRSTRDRLAALGVQGMMCSNFPYVIAVGPTATSDAFGTGLRAAGDLPWTTSKGVTYQPSFDVLTAGLTLDHAGIQSYSMGSMCPIAAPTYLLKFDLRWPDGLPPAGQHAGVAFGQSDDQDYRIRLASDVSGYHVIVRDSGSLELFARAAGDTSGTQLGSVPTGKPEAGQWMSFEIAVSPDRIKVSRDGLPTWQFEVEDAQYRGGYFSLGKNYTQALAVQFRGLSVS